MAGDGDLVVREDLLGLLFGSSLGVVWDVRGIAGAGKSVLMRELQRRAGPKDVVVLAEMRDYFVPFEPRDAAVGGAKGLDGELRRFGQVVSEVMSGLLGPSTAPRGTLDESLHCIDQTARDIGELDEGEARERVAGLVDRLRGKLNERVVARAKARGRVYLLVDTFEAVLDRPLGEWFLRLLDGLDGAVVVVARRAAPGAAPLPEAAGIARFGELAALDVGPLTDEQVRDYLVRRLGAPAREIVAEVCRFTGGHALAVGLTADLAHAMRRRGEPVTAEGLLGAPQAAPAAGEGDDPDNRLRLLVTRFVRSAKDHAPDIGEGLDSLWAVRRFDFPLLERLLGGEERVGSHRLAERLVGHSFVERRTPPGRLAEHYYVVHDRVRELCLEMIRTEPGGTERLQLLHRRAEAHYREHTRSFLGGYEGWFRYEDPGWQALVREWLYHVAQLDDAGQALGRRGLAKLFFDSFWWWGQYVPFRFCEELLTDWAEMADAREDKEDRDWGNRLREFYVRFPKNWRRVAEQGEWEAITEQLNGFQQLLSGVSYSGRDMQRVRGQVLTFLGMAERFRRPRMPEAEKHLREARDLFTAVDDAWARACVVYHHADAVLAQGEAERAVAIAEEGWRDLAETGDDDFELVANLHRIHADAAWARGERGLALDLYARAALSAYKFQVIVGDPDIPPINEYNQAFMAEMHERAADRLAELHQAGDDQAAGAACTRIRQFFAPYWRASRTVRPFDVAQVAGLLAAGRPGDVVALIFPPVPARGDLYQPDTAYELTASEVLYDMEEELAKPPGTPLPAVAD